MPEKLLKEYIGKNCAIVLFTDSFGVTGNIVEVEANWIKVETKKEIKLINGDMISSITILPEKKNN